MLYLLYGQDTFRSRQKLNEIIDRAETVHRGKFALRKIDVDEESIAVLEQELETPSLFAPLRFVVLENAASDKSTVEIFERLIQKFDLSATKNAVVVVRETQLEDKNPLLALLTKHAKVQKFDALSKSGLTSWVTNFFLARKIKISADAIQLLVEGIGADLWRMQNECEKLATWCDGRLSAQNVLDLVALERSSNVFFFVDGVMAKNSAKAAKELEALLANGEDVNGVFYLLVKQFQVLSQLFGLAQKGALPANTAKLLGVHPYVATKLASSVRKWPYNDLQRVFGKLADYDLAIKTGVMEARLALSLLIANS